ncbi:alpha/beta hydrolase [Aestuariibius sp. 2305UL40-4]|uniref:alpha/beta hydrolase n=1 Tax=Aestuariibius violaceus TaxID=3234132 RepID=UPI00345EA5A5
MKLHSLLFIGLLAVVFAGVAFWRLLDHDLDRRSSEPFDVISSDKVVSGTLWLPDGAAQAAVVLVHGDGPQDRTSAGGYAPLINAFLDSRIAVASWDKPGIGGSDGNWLHQSMADRAAETRIALDQLTQRFDDAAIGAVGFSQAGWVLPRLTSDDADFLVLIGPAVSWQDQGDYYMRTRLKRNGMGDDAIAQALADANRDDERVFGAAAQPGDAPDGMSQDRWRFIRENRDEDARQALAQLNLPLLAIWGADDLNVDTATDAATYRRLLGDRLDGTQIIVWPMATHSLLKADAYNWQLTEDWSRFATLRFVAEGRHAFAPGALEAITEWIGERANRSLRAEN